MFENEGRVVRCSALPESFPLTRIPSSPPPSGKHAQVTWVLVSSLAVQPAAAEGQCRLNSGLCAIQQGKVTGTMLAGECQAPQYRQTS